MQSVQTFAMFLMPDFPILIEKFPTEIQNAKLALLNQKQPPELEISQNFEQNIYKKIMS